MSRIRQKGLRREPPGGWPLDPLFVGVATLRTTRELFRQELQPFARPFRAWDLALWSGVTPKGSTDSVERLKRFGLVNVVFAGCRGYAPSFRLEWTHPLAGPLADLFEAERRVVRVKERAGRTAAGPLSGDRAAGRKP